MDKIHIICKLNENDGFSIQERHLSVNLTNKNHYHFNFWNISKNRNLLKLPVFYSNESLDLLYLSLFAYYADRAIERDIFPDAWTRKIKLYVPVLSIDKWINEKNNIEKLLSFLSGDVWEIEFRKRKLNKIEKEFKKKRKKSKEKEIIPNKFCMLSGGLDSFIGAIDLLENDNNIAFVGHYGGGKGVHEFQKLLINELKQEYGTSEDCFFNFHAAPKSAREESSRTRSFLFFAHAIVLASTLRKEIKLFIPENGLISLNIPLTNSRLGSSSTRTTHPHYMKSLQELLKALDIDVILENPYQFKTKGEMIIECENKDFLISNINSTMSCSHPDQGRWQKETNAKHCGNCMPCIVRRAAIERAGIDGNYIYLDMDFNKGNTSRNNLKAYKLGIEKYNNKKSKNFLRIQMAGPITENIKEYTSLYERGMQELIDLLDDYDD